MTREVWTLETVYHSAHYNYQQLFIDYFLSLCIYYLYDILLYTILLSTIFWKLCYVLMVQECCITCFIYIQNCNHNSLVTVISFVIMTLWLGRKLFYFIIHHSMPYYYENWLYYKLYILLNNHNFLLCIANYICLQRDKMNTLWPISQCVHNLVASTSMGKTGYDKFRLWCTQPFNIEI